MDSGYKVYRSGPDGSGLWVFSVTVYGTERRPETIGHYTRECAERAARAYLWGEGPAGMRGREACSCCAGPYVIRP